MTPAWMREEMNGIKLQEGRFPDQVIFWENLSFSIMPSRAVDFVCRLQSGRHVFKSVLFLFGLV
jgi:hypothetical protein